MRVNKLNTKMDWTYYLSMIHASSDPLDFLFTASEIPYKKYNRHKVKEKNVLGKMIKHEESIAT